MTIDWLWVLIGMPIGALIWWVFLRPFQMRHYERQRRELGLRPMRKLPEDEE